MNINFDPTKPTPLFNPETGTITSDFQKQLEKVGLVFDKNAHITKVEQFLRENCFQKDFDFYKNGGESKIQLNEEQAVSYLKDVYSARREIMPEKTSEDLDGIVCSGVTPQSIPTTLSKRLSSLKCAINGKGLKFKNVYVLCKNQEMEEWSLRHIRSLVPLVSAFQNINFVSVVANVESGVGRTCVEKLEKEGRVERSYVVITDSNSAKKDFDTATAALSQKCHGVALKPIMDFDWEINSYGYPEALGSLEKARIAWALSELNFRSRQATIELENYRNRAKKM